LLRKFNDFFFTASVRDTCTLKSRIESYFRTTLQLHNLLVKCVRELFKTSKGSASLPVYIEKKKNNFRFQFCVGDIISGVGLGLLAEVIGSWAPT